MNQETRATAACTAAQASCLGRGKSSWTPLLFDAACTTWQTTSWGAVNQCCTHWTLTWHVPQGRQCLGGGTSRGNVGNSSAVDRWMGRLMCTCLSCCPGRGKWQNCPFLHLLTSFLPQSDIRTTSMESELHRLNKHINPPRRPQETSKNDRTKGLKHK